MLHKIHRTSHTPSIGGMLLKVGIALVGAILKKKMIDGLEAKAQRLKHAVGREKLNSR